jgi:hypothetical protein
MGLGVAGILTMGLVMLGIAAAMMARDLLVPAFARAAVAADEVPLRSGTGEPAIRDRQSETTLQSGGIRLLPERQ